MILDFSGQLFFYHPEMRETENFQWRAFQPLQQ